MTGDKLIMLVEEDDELRGALADALSEYGFVVCEARDGSEAMEQLRQGLRPSAILLDLWRMNGSEFLEALDDDPRVAALPVFVLTGHPDDDTLADTLGMQRRIPKPVDIILLVQKLRRAQAERIAVP